MSQSRTHKFFVEQLVTTPNEGQKPLVLIAALERKHEPHAPPCPLAKRLRELAGFGPPSLHRRVLLDRFRRIDPFQTNPRTGREEQRVAIHDAAHFMNAFDERLRAVVVRRSKIKLGRNHDQARQYHIEHHRADRGGPVVSRFVPMSARRLAWRGRRLLRLTLNWHGTIVTQSQIEVELMLAVRCTQLVKHYHGKPPVEAVRGLDLASPPASASACSGPTARARPPPSKSSKACSTPPPARWKSSAFAGAAMTRSASGSASRCKRHDSPRSSPSARRSTLFRSFYRHGLEPDEAIARVSSRRKPTPGSRNSPAARSSGSRWPAIVGDPDCCSSTSRPPALTRSRAATVGDHPRFGAAAAP